MQLELRKNEYAMNENQEFDDTAKISNLQSIERMNTKVNQIVAKQFGMNLYTESNGFTQGQIYEYAGAKDYVSTITFASDSDSAQKYGQSLTVCFMYILKERKSLEENIHALDDNSYVKVKDLLNELDNKLSNEVKETGINIKDIVEILVVPLNKECNTYKSKEHRDPNIIKIPMSTLPNGNDIGWIFGFLQKMKDENIAITPEEEAQYLAYKIILNASNLTPKEHNVIFDDSNKIKSPKIAYYYLMWKKQAKGLNSKELEILNEIKSTQLHERLTQTEEALKKMGLSFQKLGKRHPQKLSLLLDKVLKFHEIRYNISGKHLLYCNFETFLHIYLRHVEELKVDNQFEERDKFQLKEENVMDVMGVVMRSLNYEYQKYKDTKPNGRFFRSGAMAYYYNGDYYNVVVNSDGSISTFYKGSGNKPQIASK